MIFSIGLHVLKTAQLHIAEVGLVPSAQRFRNIHRHSVTTSPQVLSLRPDESLYFINANYLAECVYSRIADNPLIKHVVIQCSAINDIDLSALEMLQSLSDDLHLSGVRFAFERSERPCDG